MLLNVPTAVGVTTTVSVAELPEAIVPRLSVTSVPSTVAAAPWLGVALTRVAPVGRKSLTVTLVASFGPLLVTVTV